MSARHIEQHYGYGAARIALRSEMHRVSDAGVAGDFAAIFAELGSGGPAAIARRFAGPLLGLVGIMAFLGFVIGWAVQQEASREALEVVMLQSAEAMPPVVPPMVELPVEPAPIVPEPVVPEPPPVVAEPVVPEPPPMVAEVKPEPPPPAPPKVEPVRIEPEIAKVTPPPVVERAPRPVREQPLPAARPRVAIDAVAVAPETVAPAPAAERLARNAVRPEARSMPRLAAPAAPAIDVPSEAPPERAFRVAAARAPSAPRARAIPGVAPAGLGAADLDLPSTTSRAAPTRGTPVARPAASAAPARSVPRLEIAAAPTTPARATGSAAPPVVARAERVAAPAGGGSAGGGGARPGLSGVPLGELRACVTDQEEDRLKQAVVAAVKAQSECVSGKGTYRFVETKNLNAFLMWIERAPSRRVEDRCAELRYALECLQGSSRRASR